MKKVMFLASMLLCLAFFLGASPSDKYIGFTAFMEDGGLPASDFFEFRFSIWTDASQTDVGYKVWEEQHVGADKIWVDQGEFSVYIGSVRNFSLDYPALDFSSGTQYWLDITFRKAGNSSWSAYGSGLRKLITFVPYSLHADDIQGLTDSNIASNAKISLSKIDISEADIEAMVFDGDSPTVIQVVAPGNEPTNPVTGQIWMVD